MKKQSAEVLDSADDFGRKLSWQLFQLQMAHLWGGGEGEWRPGDPLYERTESDWTYGTKQLPPMRCQTCEVDWPGDEPCWVCGVERRHSKIMGIETRDTDSLLYETLLGRPLSPIPIPRELYEPDLSGAIITEEFDSLRNHYKFRIDYRDCYSVMVVDNQELHHMGSNAREIIHEELRHYLRRYIAEQTRDR